MQQDPAVQAQQQLAMKTAEATLAKLTAEVQKVLAQVEQIKAQAQRETKVGAAYSAMQAGGVAASNLRWLLLARSCGLRAGRTRRRSSRCKPGGGAQIPPEQVPFARSRPAGRNAPRYRDATASAEPRHDGPA